MPYGRIYINNLRSKVTILFDELKSTGQLGEKNFISAFKNKYPKDYSMLEYEYRFKSHEFKKNRKGQPKHIPLRPDNILSNMYRNYFYKLVKQPIIIESKRKEFEKIRCAAGKYGYKIIKLPSGLFDVVNKQTKTAEYSNIDFKSLKKIGAELKKRNE